MGKQLNYLVVDGTDGGGKTPLIQKIEEHLPGKKIKVATVFKKEEVFELWKNNPIKAAKIIQNYIEEEKGKALLEGVDLLIFDRHWPTVYVSTDNKIAREIINCCHRTVLILNEGTHIESTNQFQELEKKGKLPEWVENNRERDYWSEQYLKIGNINTENLYILENKKKFNLDEEAKKIIDYFKLNIKNIFEKNKKVTITIGPSASGKTTWSYRQFDREVISIDTLKYHIKGEKEGSGNFYDIGFDKLLEELKFNNSFILEGTFSDSNYLEKIVLNLRAMGIDVEILISSERDFKNILKISNKRAKKDIDKKIEKKKLKKFFENFLKQVSFLENKLNIYLLDKGNYIENRNKNIGALEIKSFNFYEEK